MKDYLTIKNDKGEEKEFEILLSYVGEETGYQYVTYTDYSKDEDYFELKNKKSTRKPN